MVRTRYSPRRMPPGHHRRAAPDVAHRRNFVQRKYPHFACKLPWQKSEDAFLPFFYKNFFVRPCSFVAIAIANPPQPHTKTAQPNTHAHSRLNRHGVLIVVRIVSCRGVCRRVGRARALWIGKVAVLFFFLWAGPCRLQRRQGHFFGCFFCRDTSRYYFGKDFLRLRGRAIPGHYFFVFHLFLVCGARVGRLAFRQKRVKLFAVY